MVRKIFACLIVVGIGCVFLVAPAHAHKVNIFAYVENGKIITESYFPDGRKVEGGVVEVYDSQKQKVAEGKTDKQGKCVLPIPKKDDLTIVIDASMGHKNTFLLKKSELGE
ncbi:MAG: carboxypeptidase regulatory-like domain-containing protein [Syntrophobacter sp.]